MTPEQVQLVRSTFAKVATIKEEAAALFYRRLFELDPSLRPMFKADMQASGAHVREVIEAYQNLPTDDA